MKPQRKVVRSEEKERQILEAAKDLFREHGFDGVSTDEIARRAKVSKATLYGLFPDKRALFVAFVTRMVEANRVEIFPAEASQSLRQTLEQIGEALLTMLLSAPAQDVFRLAVGERVRFPDLARALYRAGQGEGVKQIAGILRQADKAGQAHVADPDLAAAQFIGLCRADLFYREVLGISGATDPAEIAHVVREAVETFLARYGPRA